MKVNPLYEQQLKEKRRTLKYLALRAFRYFITGKFRLMFLVFDQIDLLKNTPVQKHIRSQAGIKHS